MLWHAATKRWVMAVYDETGGRQAIVFHSSPDLKAWTVEGRIDGFFECPDLFELAVEGRLGEDLMGLCTRPTANTSSGTSTATNFTPSHTGKHRLWHGDFYAAQTYQRHAPDGRRDADRLGAGGRVPRHAVQSANDGPVCV